MAQQKALLLEKKGGAFVVDNVDLHKPASAELVVKVQATALNPLDWKIQEYGLFYETWPAIVGLDAAGNVEAIGEGVEGFTKGDRVFFHGFTRNEFATFQQYTRVPAEITGRIPEKLTYSQAASIPVCFTTAAIGLFASHPAGAGLNPTFDRSVKYPGKSALVIGGSASIGQYAIQLLKFAGFSRIIAYASGRHAEALTTLGATDVIDRTQVAANELPAAVKKITSDPIEIVYDAVSGTAETQGVGYGILADGGQLILALPVQLTNLVDAKRAFQVYGSVFPDFNRKFGRSMYKNLTQLLEEGVIVPNPVEDLPNGLAGIPDNLERIKSGQSSGKKLIAHPQQTV
ncbi:hypothetical protein VNI00_009088 [Paramarasmius palmivorus]|uniref:Enoyl reductase (ER) domain-containing protein n=1 Tax=Paramarasmius palmivorus TaxID=297713 RepID=A0AAW0CSX4_9AGAR